MRMSKGFIAISVFLLITAFMAILGSVLLAVNYQGQFVARYVNSTKAYYLAVSGVNYARQHSMQDTYNTVYPQNMVKADSFSLPGCQGTVRIERQGDLLNSKIKSIAALNGNETLIDCVSGDEDIPLDVMQGVYGAGITGFGKFHASRQFLPESVLEITGWDVVDK